MRSTTTTTTTNLMAAMLACLMTSVLALAGCGDSSGPGSHPEAVEPDSVTVPEDLESAMARMNELLTQLDDPLKVGKELHTHRPVADEIAIVADALTELAGKSHPPGVVANVDKKGKAIAKEARRLATALRKKDAATARAAHEATKGLVRRLANELPRKPAAEDE